MSVLAFPTVELRPTRPQRRRHLTAVTSADVSLLVPVREPATAAPGRPLALVRPLVAPPATAAPWTPAPGTRAGAGTAAPGRQRAEELPIRLTARGRRVLVAAGFAVAALVGSAAGSALGAQEVPPASVRTVTVQPGESLWTIAAGAAAPGEDVREVIEQIVAINGLDDSTLEAGERLTVPAG